MSEAELFETAVQALRDGARICIERHRQMRQKSDDRIALDVAFEVQQYTTKAIDAIMQLEPIKQSGAWLSIGHRTTWTVGDLMLADKWTKAAKLLGELADEVEAIQKQSGGEKK